MTFWSPGHTGGSPEANRKTVRCGVWGRLQAPDWLLRNGDRVEVYRALTVDPKEARRLRYKRQRQRSAL